MTDQGRDKVKVVILVDRDNPELGRRCFWKEFFSQSDKYHVTYLSIYDSRGQEYIPGLLFSRKSADFLIINWDVINGDPVFGNDISLVTLRHYFPDIERWVASGGVVILESQGAAARPLQEAYEPFTFGEQFPLEVAGDYVRGFSLIANSNLVGKHPILMNVKEGIPLVSYARANEEWFPLSFCKELVSSLIRSDTQRNRVFTGWFKKYHRAWEPILFAEVKGKKLPVMLCRTVSDQERVGAYVVTTMYIASSMPKHIIENLLNIPHSLAFYVNQYGNISSSLRRRLVVRLIGAIVIALCLLVLSLRIPSIGQFWYLVLAATTAAIAAALLVDPIRRLLGLHK